MIGLQVEVQFGLVRQPPPSALDQGGYDLRRTQERRSTVRVAREVFGLQVRLERFELVINRHVELEQGIPTACLLLPERGTLQGVSVLAQPSYLCGPMLFNTLPRIALASRIINAGTVIVSLSWRLLTGGLTENSPRWWGACAVRKFTRPGLVARLA
jgi:hypothetical protein